MTPESASGRLEPLDLRLYVPDLRLVAVHALLGSESWQRGGLSEEEDEISPAATAGKIMHRFWGSFELSRLDESNSAGWRQRDVLRVALHRALNSDAAKTIL